MAILPNAPKTLKVEMQYIWSGEEAENVYHVHPVTDTETLSPVAIAGVFKTWWTNVLRPITSVDASLVRIRVTDLTNSSAPQYIDTTDLPSAGGSNVDSVPNNSAPIVKWATGIRVKGGTGRTFIIGCGEDNTNGQKLTGGAVTGYTAAMNALLTALHNAATAANLVVLSYYLNKVVRTVPQYYVVLSASVNEQLGSMKTRLTGRRKKKRRPNPNP